MNHLLADIDPRLRFGLVLSRACPVVLPLPCLLAMVVKSKIENRKSKIGNVFPLAQPCWFHGVLHSLRMLPLAFDRKSRIHLKD